MDEIAIVDRVPVNIEGMPEFSHHVAIPAVEPLDVLIFNDANKTTVRRLPVYGFTADGNPLVLDPREARLVSANAILAAGERARITQRYVAPYAAVGPFTPAPGGMIAVFSDGRRLPILYYDVHGRAVCADNDARSRTLFVLDDEDEEPIRIEGYPPVPDAPGSPPH